MGGRRRPRRAEPDSQAAQPSASSDQQKFVSPSIPPGRRQDARALRRVLLGLIRGYYLDAIARLPTADLRATLARGLLVGGHCYGPLHPVHNIIANSVWCAAAFPLRHADRVEAGVVGTKGTDRAVRRSLDGSLAFLRRLCPFLSLDDALWHLCLSRADLRVAVASARGASVRSLGLEEEVEAAFQLAARTARHPQAAALAFFASSVLPDVERDVARLLIAGGKHGLSSMDIDCLSRVLLPHPLPHELSSSNQPPPNPSPKVNQVIADKRRGLARWYHLLLGLADAAVRKFAHQTGAQYELHTIYGESVVEDDDYDEYFHINFMAQPKEGPGIHRLFFFAEAPRAAHHDFREEDIYLCCQVQPSPADIIDNCLACLANEVNINHPAVYPPVLRFGGQCYELDKVDYDWDLCPVLGIDYLFFDSDRDNDLVEYLHNYFARIDAYCSNRRDGPPVVNYCRVLG